MDKIVITLICLALCTIYWITKAFFPLKKLVTRGNDISKLPHSRMLQEIICKPKPVSKTILVSGFPPSISAKEATDFLERHTGNKTVYALKLRQSSRSVRGRGGSGSYTCAITQFTSIKEAECILKLAKKRRLCYGSDYLDAHFLENDVVPKPMICENDIDETTTHFGWQVAVSKFIVLWSGKNSTFSFGYNIRKLYFLLPYDHKVYKLELSYDSISQMQLHCPPGGVSKFLLIQLSRRPFLYEKGDSVQDFQDMFLMEAQDDHWIRTVDFTPSNCIGQSPVLCLEFPHNHQLSDLRRKFPRLKDQRGLLTLDNGITSPHESELVSIVNAPKEVEIPFDILFTVNMLVQNGYLVGPTLDLNFFLKIDPTKTDKSYIEYALHNLYRKKKCLYDPISFLDEQYNQYQSFRRPPKPPTISLDSGLGLVYTRRIQVTPCRVIFCGPEALVSNRVLRNFSDDIDNFIRVSIVDEDLERLHSTSLCPYGGKRTGIDKRIRSVLRNGIHIGDKKFEFLAFSNSQLKENSLWMFASRPGLSVADIRNWMGEFHHLRNVAKYAARLGQSLGSSTETLSVTKHEMQVIDDIEVETGEGNKYVFSDGIGKISAQFAMEVAKKCGVKRRVPPSAFQIRYAGFKGVVAVDPSMPSSIKLLLRNSMYKYESENDKLDVITYSKYQDCFLNRQIITLLSTLGVEDDAFLRKQQQVTRQLDAMMTDPMKAVEALSSMSFGDITKILKDMIGCGYKPDMEPFLSKMLQTLLASKLQELRTRSRILIPDGRAMMGCLDETGTLEYGQVFVQVSIFKDKEGSMSKEMLTRESPFTYVVKGKVVVAKNPCLHPGDVRVLTAVHVPALHHMVDCVVFPQKGPRPHPNECSGSDLDGDVYFVCWDPELIPPRQIEPMDYTPAHATTLDHDITIEEVQDYFVNYVMNHSLGTIANAHTVFADKDPEKALCPPCLKLAKVFSVAVDFPKTGVPAEVPQELRVREYPDFMEKLDRPMYESESVIGKLFREVRDQVPESVIVPFTKEVATRCYDPDMEYEGFTEYVADACNYKSQYDSRLERLMEYYGIATEGEILVVRMTKRKVDADAVPKALKSLRSEVRGWFNEDLDEAASRDRRAKYAKASAWYHVTYHPDYWGMYNEDNNNGEHFLSFPWCVHEILISIKKWKTRT